jgi:hypothetical protein
MSSAQESPAPVGRRSFDWWMTLCAGWMLVGLYLDGWAHRHIPHLESFFTPWHGLLYSGFFVTFGVLGVTAWRNHARGWPWLESVPPGYRLSLIGMLLFLLGGAGDLIWHTLFGIEADIEALLSPTHLILATGGTLIGAGPFRAQWRRTESDVGLPAYLPMLLSLTFGWSVLTFFTQYTHPFIHPWPSGPAPQEPFNPQRMGLSAILIQSAFMIGLVLFVIQRWRHWPLPFGSLTVMLTVNAALMGILEIDFRFLAVGLPAGLIADGLIRRLRPSLSSFRFRLFAFAVPAVYFACYFEVLAWTDGLWWPLDLWAGAIVMAGIVGWLISYLVLPPSPPHARVAHSAA